VVVAGGGLLWLVADGGECRNAKIQMKFQKSKRKAKHKTNNQKTNETQQAKRKTKSQKNANTTTSFNNGEVIQEVLALLRDSFRMDIFVDISIIRVLIQRSTRKGGHNGNTSSSHGVCSRGCNVNSVFGAASRNSRMHSR
jgi:hypothetical protein